MIRTRDLLLYFLVLFFLFLVIITTAKVTPNGIQGGVWDRFTNPIFGDEEKEVAVYDAGEVGIDRQANLAKVREKLVEGAGIISQGEPVLTSVDTPTTSPTDNTRIDEVEIVGLSSNRTINWCPEVQNHSGVLGNVTVGSVRFVIEGNDRLLVGEVRETIVTASTTDEVLATKNFLRLPIEPFRGLSSHCLDSNVVGVTIDGQLIKNQEASRFQSLDNTTLIGYAKDGFPIYGKVADESVLDSCGGYDNGLFYAYYIRSSEPFVLACLAAEPQPLLE